jgi:hypothetical protein
VASADELIREAQYAFRNISHGSTEKAKYTARAERYAKRVIRQYPATIEASQARNILNQLNVRVDVRPPPDIAPQTDAAADFERSHSSASGHTRNDHSTPTASASRFQQPKDVEDWKALVQRFMLLPPNKKKMLGIIAVVAVFLPGGIFAVFGLIIFYALQTALLKKHLNLLLEKLGSE